MILAWIKIVQNISDMFNIFYKWRVVKHLNVKIRVKMWWVFEIDYLFLLNFVAQLYLRLLCPLINPCGSDLSLPFVLGFALISPTIVFVSGKVTQQIIFNLLFPRSEMSKVISREVLKIKIQCILCSFFIAFIPRHLCVTTWAWKGKRKYS